MIPIGNLPPGEASQLRGLLFDLDDTLLDHGELTEGAYSMLFRLREAGFELWAVTGRPQGWGAVIARQWPLAGVVAENGAIASYREGPRVLAWDPVPQALRQERQRKIASFVAELAREIPKLHPADDITGRVTDFAYDINEYNVADPVEVAGALRLASARGLRAWTSSVHLHVTAEDSTKASGTLNTLYRVSRIDPERARCQYAYIGDSENDASCFAAFRTSIGVANLSSTVSVKPRYMTRGTRSAGFTEAAEILVRLGGSAHARTA